MPQGSSLFKKIKKWSLFPRSHSPVGRQKELEQCQLALGEKPLLQRASVRESRQGPEARQLLS